MSSAVDVTPAELTSGRAAPPPERRSQLAPPRANPVPPLDSATVGPKVALSLALAALLLLGFVAYLVAFSSLSQHRAQHALRQSLEKSLGEAVAPVGPAAEGRPVAALDIAAIGLHQIVVEGTSTRDLMSGPGHLPGTVLPGQEGTSTILGKRATFGAPFDRILDLKVGDRIVATTGQGRHTYRVSSFGSTAHPAPINSANRLVLITAAAGVTPSSVVIVSADLTSSAQPVGGRSVGTGNQSPMARDVTRSAIPLAAWSQLLLLTAIVGTVMLHRGPRWPVVLCLGPVTVAVVWNVYENAAGLLPNVL